MDVKMLAIDLGLRSGIAAFGPEGCVLRYRSTNFGSRGRLRSAAWRVLMRNAGLDEVVLEGDRNLASIWERAAQKQGLVVTQVSPETWRERLIKPSDRRSGQDAKESAGELARRYIDFCRLAAPTSLRHDAAEAICIGLWRAEQLELERAVTFVKSL